MSDDPFTQNRVTFTHNLPQPGGLGLNNAEFTQGRVDFTQGRVGFTQERVSMSEVSDEEAKALREAKPEWINDDKGLRGDQPVRPTRIDGKGFSGEGESISYVAPPAMGGGLAESPPSYQEYEVWFCWNGVASKFSIPSSKPPQPA